MQGEELEWARWGFSDCRRSIRQIKTSMATSLGVSDAGYRKGRLNDNSLVRKGVIVWSMSRANTTSFSEASSDHLLQLSSSTGLSNERRVWFRAQGKRQRTEHIAAGFDCQISLIDADAERDPSELTTAALGRDKAIVVWVLLNDVGHQLGGGTIAVGFGLIMELRYIDNRRKRFLQFPMCGLPCALKGYSRTYAINTWWH
jgi:hypothetical protein